MIRKATAAEHALEVANDRYKHGLTTYLDVAMAETVALTRKAALCNISF